jgi:hypothetical protein
MVSLLPINGTISLIGVIVSFLIVITKGVIVSLLTKGVIVSLLNNVEEPALLVALVFVFDAAEGVTESVFVQASNETAIKKAKRAILDEFFMIIVV